MIQFLLNDELVRLDNPRADITVLQWLREHRLKTGTKEGCGSGDCGACTVVVASIDELTQSLRYESINSCITFVGSLHGKQLITVEDLAQDDTQHKKLHPVQLAMVEEHGSQCGFCTPGFIMSMFTLYHRYKHTDVDRLGEVDLSEAGLSESELSHLVDRYLGGNLCRCTGYAPIKRAAIKALNFRVPDKFDEREQDTIKALRSIEQQLPMHPRFLLPGTLDELTSMRVQYPGAQLLAGGTDLALEVTQQLNDIDTIIYVKHVPQLLAVTENAHKISFGAAVSLNECMRTLQKAIPASEAMMLRFGSEQVRNTGTIGGNIANASPIGDLPPLLLALNAELELQGGQGTRTLNINEYFLDYKKTALASDEFIRCVHIPKPTERTQVFVHKISKRLDDDISAVCGVFCLTMLDNTIESARVAFGGMAAVPARASAVEKVLEGAQFNEATVADAISALSEDFAPISDARASALYRTRVAANLLKRCWLQFSVSDAAVQVGDYVSG